jgi:hypothetical protein
MQKNKTFKYIAGGLLIAFLAGGYWAATRIDLWIFPYFVPNVSLESQPTNYRSAERLAITVARKAGCLNNASFEYMDARKNMVTFTCQKGEGGEKFFSIHLFYNQVERDAFLKSKFSEETVKSNYERAKKDFANRNISQEIFSSVATVGAFYAVIGSVNLSRDDKIMRGSNTIEDLSAFPGTLLTMENSGSYLK